jgi:ABC-2 type transport system permease protein
MLWYKAWLETRTRFSIALAGTTILGAYRIYNLNQDGPPWTHIEFYYFVLRQGHQFLSMMWLLAATLLSMGGLLQEKANGSISYTLGLPVSRKRLMHVRIGTGLLQAAALVVVPWAAMYTTACLTGPALSITQALFYAVVLSSGGVVFVGLALFVSSLVEGTYTVPLISLGFVLLCGNAPKSFDDINPLNFINGWSRATASNQFVGPWPWGHVLANVSIAAVLIWASVKAVERRDL